MKNGETSSVAMFDQLTRYALAYCGALAVQGPPISPGAQDAQAEAEVLRVFVDMNFLTTCKPKPKYCYVICYIVFLISWRFIAGLFLATSMNIQ